MSFRGATTVGIGVVLLAASASGCRFSAPDPEKDDTPTSGSVLVLADADCRSVIDQELLVFSALYPKAHVHVRYLGEAELVKAMLNDSVRCVVTTVAPGADQAAYFKKRQLSAPVIPIYKAGIAVVVQKNSPLQYLSVAQVAELLGKPEGLQVTTDMEANLHLDSLTALFAGTGSGVARLLADSLGIKTIRARALADVPAVVDQVARDPRTIGFLPFEAISDLDNPAVRALREQVRLLPISPAAGGPAVQPSQSSLADGSYPLRRTVTMVLTEGKSGLGTGFVSFVANHKGQRIILKLGVAPITVPPRNVEIVHP